jgi:glycosyltransferase involved in cell wall biosynthesis
LNLKTNNNTPTVSITIPCRNEENYIAKCLDSIINCDFDKDFLKVYVCDGLSTDSTLEIIEKYASKHYFIHLIVNEKQTTQYALNLGLKADNSVFKIILGAHAEIAADYITNSLKCFEIDEKIACVGGVLENVYENETSKVIGKAMSSSFGVGNAHFRTGGKDGFVDTVAFGTYNAEIFDKIGYFDEDLIRNQDDEFNFRLIKNGFKIYLSSNINAKYYVRASFKKLYRQYNQYGYWKVYVNKKHQSVTTIRQLFPMFFVSGIFVGAIMSLFSSLLLNVYMSVLGLYLFLAFNFSLKKSKNIIEIFQIIYVFIILHFSYGLGYLEGMLNFIILNKSIENKHTELSR